MQTYESLLEDNKKLTLEKGELQQQLKLGKRQAMENQISSQSLLGVQRQRLGD